MQNRMKNDYLTQHNPTETTATPFVDPDHGDISGADGTESTYNSDISAAYADKDRDTRRLKIWMWLVGLVWFAISGAAVAEIDRPGSLSYLFTVGAAIAMGCWLMNKAEARRKEIHAEWLRAINEAGE